ncbi:hypothetical protein E2R40_09200 [Rathayibacter toxicus]|nr:hypothetical protein E2R35_09210 [Rathayibacter toxicus]QWL35075.1 hypothetical protein E2R36_09210 [Rathayibacter toxicus]QWL37206.1 hypothetical protein E2R37_09205 [Rathayibacter toxicus]QWL39298.1 hypothetical protein E2R38_09200 [Rathayibacter toxicus]QWL41384.1 hypothetical protein E2R39_09205 [Rathayibacter toxicus]
MADCFGEGWIAGKTGSVDSSRAGRRDPDSVRSNMSQASMAGMFSVSHPTISRVYRRIVPVSEQACCLFGVALATAVRGRVVLAGGTDVPTGNVPWWGGRTTPGSDTAKE